MNVKRFCYDSASRAHTIVMKTHQKKLEKLNKFSTNKPMIWSRYVDDVSYIFTISKRKFLNFIHV